MWRAACLVLVACDFREAQVIDAPLAACRVRTIGAATTAGVLGGSPGGSSQPDLDCGAGELPIGFAFDMTGGNVSNNESVVVSTHVRCGSIARAANGEMTSTPGEVVSQIGPMGFCIGPWSPSSMGPEQLCPAGQVIVGMLGNEAGGSLYNTVAMLCAPALGGGSTTIGFPTGNYTNQPEHVACPGGAAVINFGVNAGCAQDELIVRCAQVTCD